MPSSELISRISVIAKDTLTIRGSGSVYSSGAGFSAGKHVELASKIKKGIPK